MASAIGMLCRRCLNHYNKVFFQEHIMTISQWTLPAQTSNDKIVGRKILSHYQLTFSRKSTMHKNIYSALYDESSTRDFIYSLHPRERELLFSEMQKYKEKRLKAEAQGPAEPPTGEQLRILAVHNSLPFIGFGFLDNLLMIVAGEYIDSTLGITLGISTMAAAGLGNLISDVAGIGSASYVESLAMKFGVRTPELTPAQWDFAKTRWTSNLAKAFGVALGCFIGMFPLLIFKDEENEKTEKDS